MSVDESIRIDADISELTADTIAELTNSILSVLQPYSVTLAHNATYSEGASADNVVLDVGAGGTVTEDWGFRILFDSGVSDNDKLNIIRSVFGVATRYTVDTIAFAAAYSAGTGTFQVEATIT